LTLQHGPIWAGSRLENGRKRAQTYAATLSPGPQHRDRDQQFRYLNRQVASFRKSGDPVLSVDTKKKELVGASGFAAEKRRQKRT
jgi:hypothetical protein